jgi:uncharacterized protein
MEGERIVLVPKKERAKVARLVKDPLTGLPMLSAGKAFANSNQGRSSRNSFWFSMKYLLDVNVLVALCLESHEFHGRVSRWVGKNIDSDVMDFFTCPMTELGYLRVIAQTPVYSFTIEHGKQFLAQLKPSTLIRCEFMDDEHGAAKLPVWVKGPKQISDGHLIELAKAHGAKLATLDENIPGTMVIPDCR